MDQCCRASVVRSVVGLLLAASWAGGYPWGAAAYAADNAAAQPAPPPASTEKRRSAAYQRMLRLLEEDRAADAVPAAFEVLELSRELAGDNEAALVTPLTNLATAQLRAGDLLAAEGNYNAAIALAEQHEGIVSARLITPLAGLAQTYLRAGQPVQAAESYERALHVNHVNDGFYNLEQMPLRDGLTESYLGQKEMEKANFHQAAQLQIMEHRVGRQSPELLPALAKLADWYERSGQIYSARLVQQDTARLIAASKGESDPALVDPLLAIATSYRLQALQALQTPPTDPMQGPDTLLPMSSVVLRKALGIVDQQAQPDPLQRARVLVEFGDLYLVWGKRNSSAEAYADAWRTLSGTAELVAQREQYFSEPKRLYWSPAPASYPASAAKLPASIKLEPGHVVVKYAVDASGRVSSAEVIESDPVGLMDKSVLNAVRRSLYRPRHVDGSAVMTEGLSLRHDYGYRIETNAAPPPEPAEAGKPLAQPGSDSRN
jgi:TonB family protein